MQKSEIDHLYRAGALWKTRGPVWGTNMAGEETLIKSGELVLVVQYKLENQVEGAVLLVNQELVFVSYVDFGYEFDMSPAGNKTK